MVPYINTQSAYTQHTQIVISNSALDWYWLNLFCGSKEQISAHYNGEHREEQRETDDKHKEYIREISHPTRAKRGRRDARDHIYFDSIAREYC